MDSKATVQLGETCMVSWSGHPEDLLGPLSRAERSAAPSILYGRGRKELLATAPRVAVVGSRRASGNGLARASEIAEELVDAGVVVVSGLALGIDTVAHQTAIDCGGTTFAVLATGLEQYATSRNRELQDKIGADHLLLSQFSEGTTVHRSHSRVATRSWPSSPMSRSSSKRRRRAAQSIKVGKQYAWASRCCFRSSLRRRRLHGLRR